MEQHDGIWFFQQALKVLFTVACVIALATLVLSLDRVPT